MQELINLTHPITKQKMKFNVRPGSSDIKGAREIFGQKAYQRPKMDFMPKPGEVWLDGGGNVGAFSVYLAPIVKKVYCYECEPSNVEAIRKNLSINNIENVEVIEKALVPDSHTSGKAAFYVNNDPNLYWRHSMFKFERRDAQRVAVRTERISDALAKGVTSAKIDIEGAEIPILLSVQAWNLDKLVFEWSFDVDKRISTFQKAIEVLGKSFKTINHVKLPAQSEWTFFPAATNVFCMR